MDAHLRAARGALWLASLAICFGSAVCSNTFSGTTAWAAPPEWQQDLDYLTWDRRLEDGATAAGSPVYLRPEAEQAGAISTIEAAPGWQLRIRDIYSLVTPRGWRSLVSRREAPETSKATATLTVPAPGLAVEQSIGPVARRHDVPASGTFVR